MKVRVRYFASLRDRLGRAGEELEVSPGETARGLLDRVLGGAGVREGMPPVAFAVNLAYVSGEQPLSDGDEVAFLPPVSGG